MSADTTEDESRPYVGFDLGDQDEKKAVNMRAAQLGYSTTAAYLRDLVRDDLDDADLPL